MRTQQSEVVLGDFFGVLRPTTTAHTPVPSKGSREISSVPNIVLLTEQNHDLPRELEAHPLIPADNSRTQLPPAVSGDSTPSRGYPRPPHQCLCQRGEHVSANRPQTNSTKLHSVDSGNNGPLSAPERCLVSQHFSLAEILSIMEG